MGSWRSIFSLGVLVLVATGLFWFSWLRNYNYLSEIKVVAIWTVFFLSFVVLVKHSYSLVTEPSEEGRPGLLFVAVSPGIWCLMTTLLARLLQGNYWLDFSIFHPEMASLAALAGGTGIMYLIVAWSTSLAMLLVHPCKKTFILCISLALFALCCSLVGVKENEGEKVTVACIQGNFYQKWRWRREHIETDIIERYLSLSCQAAEKQVDVIVWPEYAIPADLYKKPVLRKRISQAAVEMKCPLVVGSLFWHDGSKNRVRLREDAVWVFDEQGNSSHVYSSIRPVPGDRKVVKGNKIGLCEVDGRKVGILLCYEETQSDIARKLASAGAEYLLVLANNNTFRNSRGLHQASLFTAVRAVESGLYVVRCTNNGITHAASSNGRIIARSQPFKPAMMITDIRPFSRPTLYSKHGNTPLVIISIVLVALVYPGRLRYRN